MNSAILAVLLFGFLVFLEILHFFERKDLEDRITKSDCTQKKKKGNKKAEPYKTEYEKIEEEWNGV